MTIAAFTSICEEDSCWIEQYLNEIERLDIPFAIHLDRCSLETRWALVDHPLCIGFTENNNPLLEFTEQHKQGVFDLIQNSLAKFTWALAWDIDETWEKTAPEKLQKIEASTADYLTSYWVNLWEDKYHVRRDGPFRDGNRAKFHRIAKQRWVFDHPITNGCKLVGKAATVQPTDLVCIHWGIMTEELRIEHKKRWDRIYSKAVGSNPYGFWKYACDKTITPKLERHNLL